MNKEKSPVEEICAARHRIAKKCEGMIEMKSLILTIAVSMSLFGGQVPFAEPPKVQARAEVKWAKPICVEKDRYIGWPTVCRRANGEMIVSNSLFSTSTPWQDSYAFGFLK